MGWYRQGRRQGFLEEVKLTGVWMMRRSQPHEHYQEMHSRQMERQRLTTVVLAPRVGRWGLIHSFIHSTTFWSALFTCHGYSHGPRTKTWHIENLQHSSWPMVTCSVNASNSWWLVNLGISALQEGCISLHSHKNAWVCIPKTSHVLAVSLTSKNYSSADERSDWASLQRFGDFLSFFCEHPIHACPVLTSHLVCLFFSYWFVYVLRILRLLMFCLPYMWQTL